MSVTCGNHVTLQYFLLLNARHAHKINESCQIIWVILKGEIIKSILLSQEFLT